MAATQARTFSDPSVADEVASLEVSRLGADAARDRANIAAAAAEEIIAGVTATGVRLRFPEREVGVAASDPNASSRPLRYNVADLADNLASGGSQGDLRFGAITQPDVDSGETDKTFTLEADGVGADRVLVVHVRAHHETSDFPLLGTVQITNGGSNPADSKTLYLRVVDNSFVTLESLGYPEANQAEAEAATVGDRLMTPERTGQAVTALAGTAIAYARDLRLRTGLDQPALYGWDGTDVEIRLADLIEAPPGSTNVRFDPLPALQGADEGDGVLFTESYGASLEVGAAPQSPITFTLTAISNEDPTGVQVQIRVDTTRVIDRADTLARPTSAELAAGSGTATPTVAQVKALIDTFAPAAESDALAAPGAPTDLLAVRDTAAGLVRVTVDLATTGGPVSGIDLYRDDGAGGAVSVLVDTLALTPDGRALADVYLPDVSDPYRWKAQAVQDPGGGVPGQAPVYSALSGIQATEDPSLDHLGDARALAPTIPADQVGIPVPVLVDRYDTPTRDLARSAGSGAHTYFERFVTEDSQQVSTNWMRFGSTPYTADLPANSDFGETLLAFSLAGFDGDTSGAQSLGGWLEPGQDNADSGGVWLRLGPSNNRLQIERGSTRVTLASGLDLSDGAVWVVYTEAGTMRLRRSGVLVGTLDLVAAGLPKELPIDRLIWGGIVATSTANTMPASAAGSGDPLIYTSLYHYSGTRTLPQIRAIEAGIAGEIRTTL